MSVSGRHPVGPINVKAVVLVAAAVFATIAVVVFLQGVEGPAARCEDAGGHYFVGPGGVTACIDRGTFLPIDDHERH